MKIERIEIIPVCIPLKEKISISFSTWENVEFVITKFFTDEGIIGAGESAIWTPISRESQETVVGITSKHLAPALIGENPFNIEKIWKKMDLIVPGNGMAKAALDLPLYDIMGKSLNVPVYELLGGKSTDSIALAGIVGLDEVEKMVEDTTAWVDSGYKTVRIKTGKGIKKDIEILGSIREKIGDEINIRIDANQAYTPTESIHMIRSISQFDIEMVEQPVVYYDFEGLARVTRSVDVPILPHESLYSIYDAIQLDRLGAGNVYAIKSYRPGGLTLAKKLANYMELRNIQMFVCSSTELAVSRAAAAHFAVSSYGNIHYACEMTGPISIIDDIAEAGIKIENGYATVSNKAGFGVELDEKRIEKYKVDRIIVK